MPIFEKLPQILGLCPIVKFRSTLEKSDPPKHFVDPLNRKILHKLLSNIQSITDAIFDKENYFADNYQ